MENATKALEMAASVLIGMLIIGMLVFGYTQISDLKQTEENAKQLEQSNNFNQQFEVYDKEGVYGSELLSLANRVVDNSTNTQEYGHTDIKLEIKFKTLPQNMESSQYSKYNFKKRMQASELVQSYEALSKDITAYVKAGDSRYKDLSEAQTDLSRKTFKKPIITYDEGSGRISEMKFEEQ